MPIPQLSKRQLRIGGSATIAVLLVVGAYVLPGVALPRTKEANAALTDELLANYVSKDSDGDGLPDWQEALYGTDPNKADTNGDGISDGEAVKRGLLTPNALASQVPQNPAGQPEELTGITADSNTMTDQFGRAFFQAYVEASNGQPMTDATKTTLVNKLLADYTQRASAALSSSYTAVSVHTGSMADESSYLSGIESILEIQFVKPEDGNPVKLMQAYIQNDDKSAQPKLLKLADLYASVTQQLIAMSVPPQYRNDHLTLIRSYDSLSKATRLVANYEKDPIGVMGALSIFQPSSQGVVTGVGGIATKILQTREPVAGEPGAVIVDAARRAQKKL